MLGSLATVFIFVFPGVCLLQTTLERYFANFLGNFFHFATANNSIPAPVTLTWSQEVLESASLGQSPSFWLEHSSLGWC